MKSIVKKSILTSLAYLLLSPFCFTLFNTVEIHREGALIYILVLELALITSVFLFILSILLEKSATNKLRSTIAQISIGVLLYETLSLLIADSSLLYAFLGKTNWFQFGLSLGNLAGLVTVYGIQYISFIARNNS